MEEAAADWSFLDAAYLITCPDDDGSNPRLDRVLPLLRQVGLGDLVEVRSFERDDADRIRGCYSSHISVLQEAQRRVEGKRECNILVLEDNIDVSPRLSSDTLAAVREYVTDPAAGPRDMVHLAYIMYVPGLRVERTSGARERIVRLLCTPDSVLGTTAYLVTRSGLDALLAEHARHGYSHGDAIPNVMARLFPESRYAASPMPFHRAAGIKSLVNAQLDNLRAILFLPTFYTAWERLLVGSGLSTSVLFPALVGSFAVTAVASTGSLVSALLAEARGEDVNLLLPAASALIAIPSLIVIFYGARAPTPPEPRTPAHLRVETPCTHTSTPPSKRQHADALARATWTPPRPLSRQDSRSRQSRRPPPRRASRSRRGDHEEAAGGGCESLLVSRNSACGGCQRPS